MRKLGEYADIGYRSIFPETTQAIWVGDKNYIEYFSNKILSSLYNLGFKNYNLILTENSKGNGPAPPNKNFYHKYHMHIQQLNRRNFSFK